MTHGERGFRHGDMPSGPTQPSADGGGEAQRPTYGKDGDRGLRRLKGFFCSEAPLARYASGRRAPAELVATTSAAIEGKPRGNEGAKGLSSRMSTKLGLGKLGWCCAGGLGILISGPLFASGVVLAAAGTLLSIAAFLACPIGTYFMMRGMMKTRQDQRQRQVGGGEPERLPSGSNPVGDGGRPVHRVAGALPAGAAAVPSPTDAKTSEREIS